ncbi:unnamed protein product [Lepeophtheirus salmonis]|uniref:(salmon louse) hypothetical protein n=1 Tax=Lepeophtheirus salmonis TaxID=72036 RepID=A0A7R8CWF3_LEPSM|nr:unnamed protein product [Lepeophtheirus salmonis]CAF2951239.1 unnamed protein product [Lepeophtheirus salmonis]
MVISLRQCVWKNCRIEQRLNFILPPSHDGSEFTEPTSSEEIQKRQQILKKEDIIPSPEVKSQKYFHVLENDDKSLSSTSSRFISLLKKRAGKVQEVLGKTINDMTATRCPCGAGQMHPKLPEATWQPCDLLLG